MMSVREPILKPVAIAALRPTQTTVGVREVKEKRKRWRDESKKKGAEFLGKHMIPVVLGPEDRHHDPITRGIVGLVLNIGAYGAEVVRGGLQSVPDHQHEAARALNFSKLYTLLHISLPQAVVEMMPAFGNLAIQNLKDTALVSLISIADLARAGTHNQ
jgi:ABC-type amino acid transport system permease subunit